MILCMDVGNTNIKLGLFEGELLKDSWRISTLSNQTGDEYGVTIINLLSVNGYEKSEIAGIIFSSVNPSLNFTLVQMCKYYFGIVPMQVGTGIKSGLNLKYKDPKEVGADRIVNSVAAFSIYRKTAIVIDFGTASTFNVVTAKGEFLGGAIAPGIKVTAGALTEAGAKLPKVELKKPATVIAKSTTQNMQSGIINGFIGLCEYIVKKMKEELAEIGETDVIVVATGGMCELISDNEEKIIDVKDRTLTLKGLKILYDMNVEDSK